MKTKEEYEAEGMFLVQDDTPPEEKIIWTEKELKDSEERTKILMRKFKHHFK